ncbi:MAG: hypothetical protein KatS3mg011_1762 [Acidimicrobiia bacterium]|nr:MAG: hypothetical protein KatS3mg011_1762 [Acidimicrobiia bacterium]
MLFAANHRPAILDYHHTLHNVLDHTHPGGGLRLVVRPLWVFRLVLVCAVGALRK